MRAKLTKRLIDAAKTPAAGERHLFIWDTETTGLALRITQSGHKAFVFQYHAAGRDRRLTLGTYGSMLTVHQARHLAERKRLEVANGANPAEEKRAAREAPTVRDLAERFMEEHASKRKAASRRLYASLWELHILPALGARKVAEIRWEDFATLHHRMRGTPFMANRMLALASKAWGLAAQWGWYPRDLTNPARRHDRFMEKRRGRALEPAELQRIGRALAMEDPGSVPAAAFVFCMLTGARPGEVLSMRWKDLRGRQWHLADAKTGARCVYVGRAAQKTLEALPRMGEYVFPGRSLNAPLVDMKRFWERLTTRAELPEGVRLYDCTRHTFTTAALELGVPLDRVKKLVGHAPSGDITARYSHHRAEILLADADAVSSHLSAALRSDAADEDRVARRGA
jgi:integrase